MKKKFENRSTFDEIKAYEVKAYKDSVPVFWATLYGSIQSWSKNHWFILVFKCNYVVPILLELFKMAIMAFQKSH